MSYITTFLPTPAIISLDDAALAGGVATLLSANTVYLYAFEIFAPIAIAAMRWVIGTVSASTTNMGIYTLAGNLVAGSDTGAVNNVTASANTSTYGTSVKLAPGAYFLALSPASSTDDYLGITPPAAQDMLVSRCRKATNTLAAGALPLTTGVIAQVAKIPAMAAIIVGGLP